MTSGTQIFLGPARNKSEFLQFEWGSVNPLGIRSLWMPLLPPPPRAPVRAVKVTPQLPQSLGIFIL